MHEEQVVLDISTLPEPEQRCAYLLLLQGHFTQWKILGPEIFIKFFLSCNTWVL
jgi:hypothetical protein